MVDRCLAPFAHPLHSWLGNNHFLARYPLTCWIIKGSYVAHYQRVCEAVTKITDETSEQPWMVLVMAKLRGICPRVQPMTFEDTCSDEVDGSALAC